MSRIKIIISIFISFALFNCSSAILVDEEIEPIVETVKYNDDVKNIISANCVSCHGGSTPQVGLDLSTYTNVRFAVENRGLLNRINNVTNPMPPSGVLPSATRAIIEKWVSDGYLEN